MGRAHLKIGESVGFFKMINNEPVVVFLRYDTLEYATTLRPTLYQMTTWGLP